MGKVKTVAIFGVKHTSSIHPCFSIHLLFQKHKTIMPLLLICPVNERVCACVYFFPITCLVTYTLNGLTAPPFKKNPMCKGTISAVYQTKCAWATM